ncbi:unnamed protein product [Echinostoma caproni]|uniref:TPR_REGION domain-containing protein n=1 Tax=Echinostoma caproni TaxID=27848 RepID=A0A183APX3_9TREM|nr:unnamed protein product [Echinostoma caproni]
MRALTEQAATTKDLLEISFSDSILKEKLKSGISEMKTGCANNGTSGLPPRTSFMNMVKPSTIFERPSTGVLRCNSSMTMAGSIERTIRSGRAMRTGVATGRMRTAKASMLQGENGEFIHVARLNLAKYAKRPEVAKCLFEYLYYVAEDVRNALNLSNFVTQKSECSTEMDKKRSNEAKMMSTDSDPWWKLQRAKCFVRLGMLREAETECAETIRLQTAAEIYVILGIIALRADQPLRAIKHYDDGLKHFPDDIELLSHKAQIYEEFNQLFSSIALYREVARLDPGNFEALASLGAYYFHDEQPEVALLFYK